MLNFEKKTVEKIYFKKSTISCYTNDVFIWVSDGHSISGAFEAISILKKARFNFDNEHKKSLFQVLIRYVSTSKITFFYTN